MLYLLFVPFINACGSSSDDENIAVGNIETIQGYSDGLVASHEIIVTSNNLIPKDLTPQESLSLNISFDIDNSGTFSDGDIAFTIEGTSSSWAFSDISIINNQNGTDVTFTEASIFQSSMGQITTLGLKDTGGIKQVNNEQNSTTEISLKIPKTLEKNTPFSSSSSSSSDLAYNKLGLSINNITQNTPINVKLNYGPLSDQNYDVVPELDIYTQGNNSTFDDPTNDYVGASNLIDIDTVKVVIN